MGCGGLMSARVGQGSVAFVSNDLITRLSFFGASCTANVLPLTGSLSSIVLVPKKGKNAVVAFCLTQIPNSKHSVRMDSYQILVLQAREGEEHVVDMNTQFVSFEGRLGSLTNNGLLVTFGTQGFISPNVNAESFEEKKKELIEQGFRVVKDPNLLCEFLAGDIGPEDLRAAATLDQRSLIERELEEVKGELGNTKSKLEFIEVCLSREREKSERDREDTQTTIREAVEAEGNLQRQVEALKEFVAQDEKVKAELLSQVAEQKQWTERYFKLVNLLQNAIWNTGESKTLFSFLPWVKLKTIVNALDSVRKTEPPVKMN